ncbi:MAG: glycosyltransferase family 2 protein [Actinomycetota bacterium]|nr:glycosyltransferase family 2 protein [Actinomycetota bacterium]
MKLVMTLLARDEADVIEAWLAFHLNAGADYVIATDNRSQDGTTDVLETYAREGHVHLLREAGEDLRQNEWVTRMARLAATDFGADWVINSDADEFWWPRGASLGEVLDAVPERYGTVGAFLRTFGPPPEGGEESFAERMTVRFSALAPINDPASLFKPIRKVVHRAYPEIQVTRGNHALVDSPFAPLRGWYPIEVFHFPLRSHAQCEQKAKLQGTAFEKHISRSPTAYHANMFAALKSGRIPEYYDALVLSEKELERGLEQGRLVDDTRLRDALRDLRRTSGERTLGEEYLLPSEATPLDFPIPSLVEDAEYAVEAAVLGEADVVRLQRRLDTLERRLLGLELRLPTRVYRKLSGTAKRALGRDRS